MSTKVDEDLKQTLIELKQKSAEAKELRLRRDKLIETFEKLNIDIPLEVKLNYESSIELEEKDLTEKVRHYNTENKNLENYLNACIKIKDEGDMLMREYHKLGRDLEMLQSGEKLDLKEYTKYVTERLKLLENERDKTMDRVLTKDCKIDIMISKLSHIINQLQEPIKELRDKEEQGLPLSNEEKLLLKLAEVSVSNEQLKSRIDELREITTELYNQYDEMTDKLLNYLEQLERVPRDSEPLLEPEPNSETSSIVEISSTNSSSVCTSYSYDIFKTQTYDPMGVALLGLRAAEVTKAQNNIENLRRSVILMKLANSN